MTLVALGLFISAFGKTKINPETDHAVHTFWSFIVYCAETIIFFLAGVIVAVNVIHKPNSAIRESDYFKLLGCYLLMSICRIISVCMFAPVLYKKGYGMNGKELACLIHGGLRGAVGISFALIAASDTDLAPNLRDLILFDVSGCAVLTLLINAPTCKILIDKLGILVEHRIKDKVFRNFL